MTESMQSDPPQSGTLRCGLQDAVAEVVWFDRPPAPVCEHELLGGGGGYSQSGEVRALRDSNSRPSVP
jgi:hypothetical protein